MQGVQSLPASPVVCTHPFPTISTKGLEVMEKNMESGAPGFTLQFCSSVAGWLRTTELPFFICKLGVTVTPPFGDVVRNAYEIAL